MNKNTKIFLKHISSNYKNYVNISNSIVGNALGKDLLNDMYLHFYTKDIPESVIMNNKFIPYFYISAKRYAYSNYFKKNNINKKQYKEYINNINYDDENSINKNKLYIEILEILEDLYNTKQIDWYNYKLFRLFYFSEYEYDITNLNTKNVNNLRKISLRKLEKEININFMSINFSLKKTLTKIIKIINANENIQM